MRMDHRGRRARRQACVLTGFALLAALAGCIANPGDTRGDLKKYSTPVKIRSLEQTKKPSVENPVVPVAAIGRTGYAALEDIARVSGYRGVWLNGRTFGMGDHDAAWRFDVGSSKAFKAGRTIDMPAPAVRQNGKLYVPVSAMRSLFGQETSFIVHPDSMTFLPQSFGSGRAGPTASRFADAPSPSAGPQAAAAGGGSSAAAGLIRFAEKYIGVPYAFGTGPYEETGKFDCSSFTQYVYKSYGVDLPRLAREQARVGRPVDRDSLQPGDLLFFYVPGRFKSNTVAGHVGIYMGGGQMIHACPQPKDGVQISDINTDYWQRTFLNARRVL